MPEANTGWAESMSFGTIGRGPNSNTPFRCGNRRLVQIAPNNPEYSKEEAWSAIDLGNIQLSSLRNPPAAQRSYEIAIRMFDRLSRSRPADQDVQRDLANAYGWLADSLFMQHSWPQSLDARLKQYAVVTRLVRIEPHNLENIYRMALAQRAVAHVHLKLGDKEAAAPLAAAAWDSAVRLTDHDPRNAEWLLFRAFLGSDIFFSGVALPAGTTKAGLKSDILRIRAPWTARKILAFRKLRVPTR